ncbi:MAG: DUF1269 domain-containing protein [Chloroflexota bacterium]|nr:MAG: DUF1269 domain-containing protein [Chloroflexota bacterium]
MSEESAASEGIRVIAYNEEEAAAGALETLEKAKKDKTIQFWDAAVIRKDERGRYYYHETRDRSTPKGAGIGAVIGGLIGIPGGPAGIVVGAGLGASLGAFAASTDAGLNDDTAEELGRALKSGNSALVVVSSREYLGAIQEYAAEEETTAAIQKLTAGISEHMEHGQNVAYLVTAAGRSVSCHRLDADDDVAKLLGL